MTSRELAFLAKCISGECFRFQVSHFKLFVFDH